MERGERKRFSFISKFCKRFPTSQSCASSYDISRSRFAAFLENIMCSRNAGRMNGIFQGRPTCAAVAGPHQTRPWTRPLCDLSQSNPAARKLMFIASRVWIQIIDAPEGAWGAHRGKILCLFGTRFWRRICLGVRHLDGLHVFRDLLLLSLRHACRMIKCLEQELSRHLLNPGCEISVWSRHSWTTRLIFKICVAYQYIGKRIS